MTSTIEEVRTRAYQLWEARGRPHGSPDTDWFAAEAELEARRTAARTLARPPETVDDADVERAEPRPVVYAAVDPLRALVHGAGDSARRPRKSASPYVAP